jgi:hypothetical protein
MIGACALMLSAASDARQWNFKVLLDQRPIGHHRFEQDDTGVLRRVISRAQFSVEWLRIPVYRYKHVDEETWRDGCLDRIDAQTHTNGHAEKVSGRRETDGFTVQGPQGQARHPGCVMSFAYWDKRILSQPALLNAQTGAYTPIQVEAQGSESLTVAGHVEPADRFLLKAGDLRIQLWYSPDGRWLQLAAPTRDGRQMLYQLEP